MSRTFRRTSSSRLSRGEKESTRLRDGSYTRPLKGCENNCGCPYCERNRLHKHNKQPDLKEEVKLSDLDKGSFDQADGSPYDGFFW